MNTHLRLVEPDTENREVAGTGLSRPANRTLRPREHLTEAEIKQLMKTARDGRWGHRDATLILIAWRHGLRAKEIAELQWSQVEFGRSARLHVRRAKNGEDGVHPIQGDELRALRELRRQYPDSTFVFTTERDTPFHPETVNQLVKAIGKRARLPFPVHCHMLRHSCGYALINAGHSARHVQDWLGHKAIHHTVRYTKLSPDKFKDFWRD
jgi:integrase